MSKRQSLIFRTVNPGSSSNEPSSGNNNNTNTTIGSKLYKRTLNFSTARSGEGTSSSDTSSNRSISTNNSASNNIDEIAIDDDELDLILKKHEEEKKNRLKRLKYNKRDFPQIDMDAAKTWIFPTNIAERAYQFKICEKALFVNTLVCLPTGLGKTLIASVIMYNFHRWFPTGKIIFIAHTVSLVEQQINACYNIMGIPEDETVCLTGKTSPKERAELWKSKRVFFSTPECVQKDLEKKICPVKKIVLVVFDEAHKATGNYSYCEVVKLIGKYSDHWRVVGLSATPGRNHEAIQKVITNLRISHVEVRDENDKDVAEYIHEKETKTIICNRDRVSAIIDTLFYRLVTPFLEKLVKVGALYQADPASISKGALLTSMKRFYMVRKKDSYKYMGDFNILISLYNALYYLHTQDMSLFLDALNTLATETTDTKKKNVLQSRNQVIKQPLFKNMVQTAEKIIQQGYVHPKLKKLEEVILEHFTKSNDNTVATHATKAVVFSGYRKTVDLIADILGKHDGILKVSPFIGQSKGKGQKGFNQKKQKSIIEDFRKGVFNVLVATQIGEEGLDIGEVDLIVLYDTVGSPTRFIQRVGRTGRRRKGNIVAILSEGKERSTYEAAIQQKRILFEAMKEISYSNEVRFFENSMRMIPDDIIPTVSREHITVEPLKGTFSASKTTKRKRKEVIVDSDNESDSDSEFQPFDDDDDELGTHSMDLDESKEDQDDAPTIVNPFDENNENHGFGGDDLYHLLNTDNDPSIKELSLVDQPLDLQHVPLANDEEWIKYKQEKIEKSKDVYKTNGHMDLDKILGTSSMINKTFLSNDNYGEEKPLPLLSFLLRQSTVSVSSKTLGREESQASTGSEIESPLYRVQQHLPDEGLLVGNDISLQTASTTTKPTKQHTHRATSLLPSTKKIKPNVSTNDFYEE
ncbi:hypothetical protein C9374_003326 [Naegleria lovaniensis]|uniref:DNA helicase n=1 Tax=Naegleria lovaniensis TaxID=51637 RepID=A0AA88KLM3_NAELO|nr:uncharacterized protein C9374_003326 [Naegleria lovaniensis]KAG2385511.1 hypothetical protein C9374_003326 [Naegleria lovaniensis]